VSETVEEDSRPQITDYRPQADTAAIERTSFGCIPSMPMSHISSTRPG
jgi:hypothetical protein